MRLANLAFCLAFVLPVTLRAELRNGDFQRGAPGQLPADWVLSETCREAGYRCVTAQDASLPGMRSAVLSLAGKDRDGFGTVMQALEVAAYRGKRVRLRGQLRLEAEAGQTGRAQMWLRVDRPAQRMGFFDNMQDRPVAAAAWTPVEIIGDVAADAEALVLGVLLASGGGNAHIAPLTLEVLGDPPPARDEPARPLTQRELQNLQAFTRVLNQMRFFHPSDAAATAPWERSAIEGVRLVGGATSPADLARRLKAWSAPYAPTARFLTPGRRPEAVRAPAPATRVVRWLHCGFGQGDSQSPYHSERQYLPLAERAGKGWPDPLSTRPLTLGGGVRLLLPSVCFVDATGATLPRVAPAARAAGNPGLPEPTGGCFGSGDDRATRLADVALVWGVFRHFYPYSDRVKPDWDGELVRALRSAAEAADATAFTHTLRRLVAALKDGHGRVDGCADDAAVPSLQLVMLDGQPVVQFAGESAREVPAGSRILSVDGLSADARLAALRPEISAASAGWMNQRLAMTLLAGAPGTTARVGYRTAAGLPCEAVLPRDTLAWELRDVAKPVRAELRPGIWYVDLGRLEEEAFQELLPKLAQARGVVFDLRGYPRIGPAFLQHLSDRPLASARWNIPMVTRPEGAGWEWDQGGRWNLEPRSPRITGKVAFLAGGGTISYGESCLGIVEAFGLGEIVGEPTAGTNGNVNPVTLPGGYQVAWTGMKVLKHDGSVHHGVGIRPTVPVTPTVQGLAEGRDEVLAKGLEVVSR